MTKCKTCNNIIPDGTEYCDDCLKNNKGKLSESYLDSLLNSVSMPNKQKQEGASKESDFNHKNKSANHLSDIGTDIETNLVKENQNVIDTNDLESDVLEVNQENLNLEETDDIFSFIQNFSDDDNNNDLVDNNEQETNNELVNNYVQEINTELDRNNSNIIDNLENDNNSADIINLIGNESNSDILNFVNNTDDLDNDNLSVDENDDHPDDDLMALLNMITGLENQDSQQYEDFDDDSSFREKQSSESANKSKSQNNLFLVEGDEIHMMDDLDFDGTKNPSSNYEVMDLDSLSDIKTADDLNSLKANSQDEAQVNDENKSDHDNVDENNKAKDFSGVFSDSISAVDTLGDLHNTINLFEEKPKKKGFFQNLFSKFKNKGDKKSTKENNKENSKKNSKSNDDDNLVKGSKDKNKFSNKESARDLAPSNSRDREKSKDKENSNEKVKKKNFSFKGFKKKNDNTNNDNTNKENIDSKNKNKKAIKKNAKHSEKKAKKLAKKKSQNIINELETEVDEGKINKVGATIIFVIIGMIAIVIIFGTDVFTYSLSINTATTDFNRQRYTDAYDEIYGLNVHKSDKQLYNKIMTVMYVKKQLDSYSNYKEIGKYPEALDSLIKGLDRYEYNLKQATKLGIKDDLDSIRQQILNKLKTEFDTTEKEAMKLVNTSDQTDYSNQIIEIASKKTK